MREIPAYLKKASENQIDDISEDSNLDVNEERLSSNGVNAKPHVKSSVQIKGLGRPLEQKRLTSNSDKDDLISAEEITIKFDFSNL